MESLNVHCIVALGIPDSCSTHLNVTFEPLNTATCDTGTEILGATEFARELQHNNEIM